MNPKTAALGAGLPRGGAEGVTCPVAREHRGAWGSELSGLECKIHQLKPWPEDAMIFFYFGPKFEHLRYDHILLITRC